ncbi:MAG: cell wall hydrolase [Novosphingobium sp.]
MTNQTLPYPSDAPARTGGRVAAAWMAIVAAVSLCGFGSVYLSQSDQPQMETGTVANQARALESLTTGQQAEVLSEGDAAKERNALIPVSDLALEQPGGFKSIAANSLAHDTALTCLSQAIYYEAANEPVSGKRAVAQVVLNRLRHPAYPHSVCGVVYEGANKPVCQFSFTCDGSLLRKPGGPRWRESQEVAKAALSGMSEPSVGTATHYHADYVLPRWAFTLSKITQIGAHIFYRFPNSWGRRTAFTAHWAGREAIPALDYGRLQAALDARTGAGDMVFDNGLTVPPHVTDRHAANDVGGRLDTTKQWRLTIPDPGQVSSGYSNAIAGQQASASEAGMPLAVADHKPEQQAAP